MTFNAHQLQTVSVFQLGIVTLVPIFSYFYYPCKSHTGSEKRSGSTDGDGYYYC